MSRASLPSASNMDPSPVYFIHVPRTAGTFTTRIMNAALGERFFREGHTVPACCMRPWLDRFGPAHFTVVPRDRCTVFTIVRNPFDLLVSMYKFGFPYWAPRYAPMKSQLDWPFDCFRDFIHKIAKWRDFPWRCP